MAPGCSAHQSAHALVLSEASRLARARRDAPTGALAISGIVKHKSIGVYGQRGTAVTQVPLKAATIDEPLSDEHTVDMLSALPSDESEFYAHENNVIDWEGKSLEIFRELESHYGFVGGTEAEYAAYFLRKDMDPTLWWWGLAE